jgi:hypothetical protein
MNFFVLLRQTPDFYFASRWPPDREGLYKAPLTYARPNRVKFIACGRLAKLPKNPMIFIGLPYTDDVENVCGSMSASEFRDLGKDRGGSVTGGAWDGLELPYPDKDAMKNLYSPMSYTDLLRRLGDARAASAAAAGARLPAQRLDAGSKPGNLSGACIFMNNALRSAPHDYRLGGLQRGLGRLLVARGEGLLDFAHGVPHFRPAGLVDCGTTCRLANALFGRFVAWHGGFFLKAEGSGL